MVCYEWSVMNGSILNGNPDAHPGLQDHVTRIENAHKKYARKLVQQSFSFTLFILAETYEMPEFF